MISSITKQPPEEITPDNIRLIPIKSRPSEQLKTTQTKPNSLFDIYFEVSVLPEPAGPEAEVNLNIPYDYDNVE